MRQDRHSRNITGLKSFIKNIKTEKLQIASDKEKTGRNRITYCLSYRSNFLVIFVQR